MKNKILVICSIICIAAITSCSKKEEKQYSTWMVNGEGFSTNKVTMMQGKGWSGLNTDDRENGFTMGWGDYGMRGPGVYQISIAQSNDPTLLRVSFNYKGVYYSLSPYNGGKLIGTLIGEKMQYKMPAAWFKNYYDPLDSVLISATLNQP